MDWILFVTKLIEAPFDAGGFQFASTLALQPYSWPRTFKGWATALGQVEPVEVEVDEERLEMDISYKHTIEAYLSARVMGPVPVRFSKNFWIPGHDLNAFITKEKVDKVYCCSLTLDWLVNTARQVETFSDDAANAYGNDLDLPIYEITKCFSARLNDVKGVLKLTDNTTGVFYSLNDADDTGDCFLHGTKVATFSRNRHQLI